MNPPTQPGPGWRLYALIARLAVRMALVGLTIWSTMAIYFSNVPWPWLRLSAAAAFGIASAAVFWRVKPWWLGNLILFAGFAFIVVWFLLTPPSNQRDWAADVAVLPTAEIRGDLVTLQNVRNFDYRSETDYRARYYDKTLDLAKLRSVDLYIVYWGSPLIAHTMLSFGFEGGTYICFSIETRKEKGEDYSAIRGFFRQFELTYIIGDERDLVGLRTNFRHEQVYLYRLSTDVPTARSVFLDYLKEVNRLRARPEWYNALTSNCTTNIRGHTYPYARRSRWDWRILVNGYLDEMLYQKAILDRSLPFKELKTVSLINDRAKAAQDSPAFSARIRDALPGFGNVGTPP